MMHLCIKTICLIFFLLNRALYVLLRSDFPVLTVETEEYISAKKS